MLPGSLLSESYYLLQNGRDTFLFDLQNLSYRIINSNYQCWTSFKANGIALNDNGNDFY